MGDIICKFEERGFKLAALKFVQASESLLKNHYADLAKKPFFPELVRYMMSGPIVAMVWTGLNIVPMVRAMVGATKPSDAAPGSIRGDLCVDVGRNLIHASDSVESAQKEVASWFPEQEIVQWRPCSLEWTYEDEVVEEDQNVIITKKKINLERITRHFSFVYFGLTLKIIKSRINLVWKRFCNWFFPFLVQGSSSPSSLAAEIAKARQHIKNSLECVSNSLTYIQ